MCAFAAVGLDTGALNGDETRVRAETLGNEALAWSSGRLEETIRFVGKGATARAPVAIVVSAIIG